VNIHSPRQCRAEVKSSTTAGSCVANPTGTVLPTQAFSSQMRCQAAITFQGALIMFGWALTFLVVALIAAVLGFGGIAGFAVEIAKIIFFVAIVLFVVSAIIGLVRGRTPTVP
jgi:uncharacterized membrane protein YtjA (UPF0391 family)